MAARLAAKHREPNEVVPHPKVVIKMGDGSLDQHMMTKLADDKYVPYCFGTECGRTRRKPWGFQCPTCGNKMNWDLTHYDGNLNVEYVGTPPIPSIKDWNAIVDQKKVAKRERKLNQLKG
jgi:hypothetical protein